MKYKIKFEGEEVEIEASQPQTALNKCFFGDNVRIENPKGTDFCKYIWKNINPLIDLPNHSVTIENSNGDIWVQSVHFSQFTSAGTFMDNIKLGGENGKNK